MINGPVDINASLEDNYQALLRKAAKDGARSMGMRGMFVPDHATFDVVPGIAGGVCLLRQRDPHAGIGGLPDGDPYGAADDMPGGGRTPLGRVALLQRDPSALPDENPYE